MKENSLSNKKKTITPVQIIDEDQQKKKNFQLIGQMFGNLTQSINVNNKDNIKNNSNNKFSGGFKKETILKNNNSSLNDKNKSRIPQPKQSKIDRFTVYDQFGLINDSIGKRTSNSKGKPKYRQDQSNLISNQSSNLYRIQQSGLVDQMKDNRRQQFQQVIQNNYVNLHEYYDIAKQKDRQQTVIHVKSSLDNMTLQNVQAKLQAHRRELRSVEEQYKQKKGITPENQYNYQQTNSPNKNFVKTGENDLYKQYGKTQGQIYELIKKGQKEDQKQLQLDQMWEQKLKQNPKLVQYSKKYQQYLVQKNAKSMLYGTVRQNLFTWDKYRKAQNQKSKTKITLKSSISRQKNISTFNKSLEKFQQHTQLEASSYQKTNISEVLASKDDKFIAKYIFASVDIDKKGLLSKEELLDYITKSQHIIKSYNIDLKWIYTDLDNFDTKRKGMLNRDELGIFLATFQRLSHPQIKLKNISSNQKQSPQKTTTQNKLRKQSPFQVSFSHDLYRFRNLFNTLDLNQDKILKRQEFIQNIFIDPECSKIIDKVVIKIKIIEKQITYRQMIAFVLDDYRNQRNQKLKKSKQYITFERFCQYFQFPETINLKHLNKKKNKKIQPSNQIEIYSIESQYLQTLKDVFDTIPRVYQDYIVTTDFIQTALMDPQVLSFQQQLSRIQSIQTGLSIETVRLTLQRMIKQSDQYIDWQTAKTFFSQRGRPLQWNGQLINKKKNIRQQQRTKSINETLKKQLIMKNQFEISAKLKSQYQKRQKRTSQNNFTIPQPFKITDEINDKQKVKKVQEGQSAFKQMSKTFKAKPVNKEILESKPHLIQGKRAQSAAKPSQYKYQNYENDRIQRALKKAQQKYQLQQEKIKLKQISTIKANQIGIDLTKDWMTIFKQQKKKQKEKQKDSKNSQLSEQLKEVVSRLHATDDEKTKLQKIKEKTNKINQANKKKDNQSRNQVAQKQKKNKQDRQKAQQLKKQKQQSQKNRQIAAADHNQTFKPKINKKPISQQQLKAIEQGRNARNLKQKQAQLKALKIQQQKRKKILQKQLKDPYLKSDQMSNDQIIDKIYDINIFDILIDEDQRSQFEKQHHMKEMDKRERQKYLKGMANKFKIVLQKEEKTLKQLKIKQKEIIQKQKTAPKQNSSISDKGSSQKLKRDMHFNGSKALRRYRQIIDGKTPSEVPSQYDRYNQFQIDAEQKNKSKKVLQSLNQNQDEEDQ